MIATHADIESLIGEALFQTRTIARDKADFAPAFWDLSTGLLGELTQKLANYQMALELTGDFSEEMSASSAFRDCISEMRQRGGPIVFRSGDAALARDNHSS